MATTPTTRNERVWAAPDGLVIVTRTRAPIRAPALRRVEAPRAIWFSPDGSRPCTADSSSGPLRWSTDAATARTWTWLTVMPGDHTWVIWLILWSRSR